MSDIEDRARTVVAQHLAVGEDAIEDGSALVADLGADSLDLVELVMGLEEEFGIEIPDDAAEGVVTFGDLTRLLGERTSAASSTRAS